MKRWSIPFLLVLLACVPILLRRSDSPVMLRDTDTAVLLETIRARNAPLSWFEGDWPLGNHFYRPISTLFFEMDNAVYGNNAAGFGLTNALLCVLCVFLLFWFVRELSDSPFVATGAAVLFALWTVNASGPLATLSGYVAWLALVGGFIFHRTNLKAYLPAFLVLLYLSSELMGIEALMQRMIGWLPGRTASVMTVFALISLAAYARYERVSAKRETRPAPGPFDPPATKSTQVQAEPSPTGWVWVVVAVLGLWLALGSYEQAVMLPATLLGVAFTMRFQRYRPRWGWQAVFWLSLIGYLALRHQLVPSEVSGYQRQQFRTGVSGLLISLSRYVFPVLGSIPGVWAVVSDGWAMLITPHPWVFVWDFVKQATTLYEARRQWVLAVAGWALSILAFLPMAWMKPFEHYHYWPMAMRTVLVMALVVVAKDLFANAWSRPGLQAPSRPTPAPGSLPRP